MPLTTLTAVTQTGEQVSIVATANTGEVVTKPVIIDGEKKNYAVDDKGFPIVEVVKDTKGNAVTVTNPNTGTKTVVVSTTVPAEVQRAAAEQQTKPDTKPVVNSEKGAATTNTTNRTTTQRATADTESNTGLLVLVGALGLAVGAKYFTKS